MAHQHSLKAKVVSDTVSVAVCVECHVYYCTGTVKEIDDFLRSNPGLSQQRFMGMNRKARRSQHTARVVMA